MNKNRSPQKPEFGARCKPVDLNKFVNWPKHVSVKPEWKDLAAKVLKYPVGRQRSWGIPFQMVKGAKAKVILVRAGDPGVEIPLNLEASYLCLLHAWEQLPADIEATPREGLVVAEYVLHYTDGAEYVHPVRGRFEVLMAESPGGHLGPAFQAMFFSMPIGMDPVHPRADFKWGLAQTGVERTEQITTPLVYAMRNPSPEKKIKSLKIRGLHNSPFVVAGLTLYQGASHPLQHLPRRMYRVHMKGRPAKIENAKIDLGNIVRIEHTPGPVNKKWLASPYAGGSFFEDAPPRLKPKKTADNGEDLLEIVGAPDATVSVKLAGQKGSLEFSLGEAFLQNKSVARAGSGRLEVLGKARQWMKVNIIDSATGKPTPVRLHIRGAGGEYIAPYGHHTVINGNWFEDYGADVIAGGRNYAYVQGQFTTDLPIGDLYVELNKGFEYEPTRQQVTIRPGQRELTLTINRCKDLRRDGWVTADTHVHFISPHTAWLEAQCEGVNVVNLLASQWGRLFTNVGDYLGRVGIVEDDTIVYVGTENRNHMLGHMSMLGTQGILPVYPMCCGGPKEAYVGDPDYMALTEWAMENRSKGGLVIRPHFPYCGFTEDPVSILKNLVDAVEIQKFRGEDFPVQEWYRYLNCGYKVAVAGGTDKMRAGCALGWLRTYALLDPNEPFTYEAWARAVRAGRTFATNGPLMNLTVEGKGIGETIQLPAEGADLEVQARADSFWPMEKIEIVYNGKVVAAEQSKDAKALTIHTKVRISTTGWLAARCSGRLGFPGGVRLGAHTSPIYMICGNKMAFDTPAAEHMLALVEGGIEYLQTLSTAFDESSRKRMIGVYQEAQRELKRRLSTEGGYSHHPGSGSYHRHEKALDHSHP